MKKKCIILGFDFVLFMIFFFVEGEGVGWCVGYLFFLVIFIFWGFCRWFFVGEVLFVGIVFGIFFGCKFWGDFLGEWEVVGVRCCVVCFVFCYICYFLFFGCCFVWNFFFNWSLCLDCL